MASAQLGSINTYSPYSMYGMGELQTQGTIATRSMGGAGIALRSMDNINLLNPASYSIAVPKGVLFNFGVEGTSYFSSQVSAESGEMGHSSYTTANFRDIALQIPIAKGMGIGISVAPYSSVGYELSDAVLLSSIGYISTDYMGQGDVTEVKVGYGWQIAPRLSLGVAARYYWGSIERYFQINITNITGDGSYNSALGVSTYSCSSIKGQVGLQWTAYERDKKQLILGATYDFGGDLSPRYTHKVIGSNDLTTTVARGDTTTLELIMPRQLAAGVGYQSPKLNLALDYEYQNWGEGNTQVELATTGLEIGYNNVSTIRAGIEYTPNRMDIRKYMRRVSYRAGARYGNYYQSFGGQTLYKYAATAGLGMPTKAGGVSKIDLGLEWGMIGTTDIVVVESESIGLIRQNYIKFSLGLTIFGNDYWFQRPKFD